MFLEAVIDVKSVFVLVFKSVCGDTDKCSGVIDTHPQDAPIGV